MRNVSFRPCRCVDVYGSKTLPVVLVRWMRSTKGWDGVLGLGEEAGGGDGEKGEKGGGTNL